MELSERDAASIAGGSGLWARLRVWRESAQGGVVNSTLSLTLDQVTPSTRAVDKLIPCVVTHVIGIPVYALHLGGREFAIFHENSRQVEKVEVQWDLCYVIMLLIFTIHCNCSHLG